MKDRLNDVIISGINIELTGALKAIVHDKVTRLFNHEGHIIRIRIELEFDPTRDNQRSHIAKGHIEIKGRDMVTSVATDDLYKSIDLMTIKLDRMLRRRARLIRVKRKQPHPIDIPAEIPKADRRLIA